MAKFKEIETALKKNEFSRNSNLEKTAIDWARMRHTISLNGVKLDSLLKGMGLDYNENPNIDTSDPQVQAKFKKLLSLLLPNINPDTPQDEIDAGVNQLCQVLHQGGLPCSLETQIAKKLNSSGYMLDDTKRGMTRAVSIATTSDGFSLTEVFRYQGNSSLNNPDEPLYKDLDIIGKCQYHVQISGTNVTPRLTSMAIHCEQEAFTKILDKDLKGATRNMRAELANARKAQSVLSSERREEDIPTESKSPCP